MFTYNAIILALETLAIISYGLGFRIYLDHGDITNFHSLCTVVVETLLLASRGTYYATVFFQK